MRLRNKIIYLGYTNKTIINSNQNIFGQSYLLDQLVY